MAGGIWDEEEAGPGEERDVGQPWSKSYISTSKSPCWRLDGDDSSSVGLSPSVSSCRWKLEATRASKSKCGFCASTRSCKAKDWVGDAGASEGAKSRNH